ncbi:N-acyl-D-amino-acid deacylase family protein [Pelagerythrobacter marensis]|uniref:Putative hydrolase n=1 Tax=Pelagerythrobacter marensis TaxID=543877 RepID=A0A0G3X8R3_9SPHN|nr:amidohydrolase family protein [Pelagerythrobacter marensis]AKM06758.1 Putative hydrolase [Pelagerythrobacter marensis]
MKDTQANFAGRVAGLLGAALVLAAPAAAQARQGQDDGAPADLLITGGTIYPGGGDPFTGDIAITGDRIVYAGPQYPHTAQRTIPAEGMIVAPGFIDPHTHADDALMSDIPAARLVLPFITQGVTTAFIGVDGRGDPDVAVTFGEDSGRDYGVNFATYVGLGALRGEVIGSDDRPPTQAELAEMVALTDQAMCQGALGLSTGLFYAPQSYAEEGEVVALARAAARHGGIYDSHIRDESSYTIGLAGAVAEAIDIGKHAGIPVHIAHIKALGVDVHGQAGAVIEAVETARANGQVVHADQYPWPASGTGLSAALMPRWAQDGGREAMLARFDDPDQMARIRSEMAENMRRRGGPASLLITRGPADVLGKTLEDLAPAAGGDPVQAAIDVLRRAEAGVASFNQDEADIAAFMVQPWVMTSSDASAGHPRYYASYARKYDTYVRERQVIDLRQFIDQSTVVPARAFSIEDRGTLSKGAFADVVVFDPEAYAPRATFLEPTLFSTGVRTVVINGVLALDEGAPTGKAAGRPLPRQSKSTNCPAP